MGHPAAQAGSRSAVLKRWTTHLFVRKPTHAIRRTARRENSPGARPAESRDGTEDVRWCGVPAEREHVLRRDRQPPRRSARARRCRPGSPGAAYTPHGLHGETDEKHALCRIRGDGIRRTTSVLGAPGAGLCRIACAEVIAE